MSVLGPASGPAVTGRAKGGDSFKSGNPVLLSFSGDAMCEFCIQHGDGVKWYLNAANYARDLLDDLRREKYIEEFLPGILANSNRWLRIIDRGQRYLPTLTGRLLKRQTEKMKQVHFGQVIPLEDVKAILELVGQVVRIPCICRETLHRVEEPVCYLVTTSPDRLGFTEIISRRQEALPIVDSMEAVRREDALAEMERLEDRGMIHTVWTFVTPFIGAICNCDQRGCLGMNFTRRGLQVFFPGEDVIRVDPQECVNCGSCIAVCLFGALSPDGADSVRVDPERCQGCGICRRSCPAGALVLIDRHRQNGGEDSRHDGSFPA